MMSLGSIAALAEMNASADRKQGMDAVIAQARYLNHLYCWSDKHHLWPIVNRHVYRMNAMYRGKRWTEVESVESALSTGVPSWVS
jgi:hypothetical protein